LEELHRDVPPGWYYYSVRKNLLQYYVHNFRFKEVSKLVEKSNGRLLDIGCADGMFTNIILKKSKAKEIIGIDVCRGNIGWAHEHWKNVVGMKYILGDAEKLKFGNKYFNAVFALEVLEHVKNPGVVVEEIERVLKNRGYAIFLVPSENYLFKFIWFFWSRFGPGKVWKETHINYFKNNILAEIVKKRGFIIEVDKKIIFGTLHLVKARKLKA
jgi:2-polyprenyl-3-methyl-5-hydroxy-6-metoxy-1,4-benzoquinol methylase